MRHSSNELLRLKNHKMFEEYSRQQYANFDITIFAYRSWNFWKCGLFTFDWYSCHKFNIKNLKFLVVWKKWLSKWTAKFCGGMGNQTDFFSGLKFWSKIPIDLERFFITDPTNTHQKISFCFITLLPKLQISLMSSWLEIKSFTI